MRSGGSGGQVLSSDDQAKLPHREKNATIPAKDRDMGSALRSIYQQTIEEKIPDEMLLLLGKLD
ncbi:NepR family anti-sigma factor [uncultured Sphingomonas sp.]|uniref:NepR family anti-sigma factor n=1 Tax=uncultured Sphingomonas sp. TaxID=158754 RepID=UPI00262AB83A|nr:NepR family anti-sigma factor [uncultured Sphingomonas sp.]